MLQDFLKLSFSNLSRRKLRSWLTMIGIFIGIAAVVSLITLGQGLQTAITGQFSTLSADMLVIQNSGTGFGPPGSTSVQKLTEHDVNVIKKASGIKEIIERDLRVGKIDFNKISQFSYIASMPKTPEQMKVVYDSFNAEIESGRALEANDRGKIIIGSDVATNNAFERDLKIGNKLNIQGEDFEIVGILKKSNSLQINIAILMPEDDMKRIFDIGDEIDFVVVQVEDETKTEDIANKISENLRRDRNEKIGEEDFSVQTPIQALSTITTILNIINLIVAGIAAISLLIGGIGIANTMYTSVLERRKEIGTMKAIGARNSDILLIFLIESGMLGLVGGIIGVSLGILGALGVSSIANAYFGSEIIKLNLSWTLFLGAAGFSFFIGIISGILPAYQGSRMSPVDALRS